MHTLRIACTALLATVSLGAAAMACQIPVFRYALENWQPEPYLLIVAHRGELSSTDKALLTQLERTVDQHRDSANLELKVVDLAKAQDPVLDKVLGPKVKSIQSPRMVLIFPFNQFQSPFEGSSSPAVEGRTPATPGQAIILSELTPTIPGRTPTPPGGETCPDGKCDSSASSARIAWSGDLTADHIRQLAVSPVRRQISDRLLDGHSAVWVLVECGDKTKDDAAAARLEKTLSEMQSTLTLPDKAALVADEHYNPNTKIQLRIEFSVLRIPRQRGDEAIFAETLLHGDPEVNPEVAGHDEPLAISIFGRGRSYYALVGEDITAASIEVHCRFLIGDCSCQVKTENPGTELLFAVDWKDRILGRSSQEKPLPGLSGIGVFDPPAGSADNSESTLAVAEVEENAPATNDKPSPVVPLKANTPPDPPEEPTAPTATESRASAPAASMLLTGVVGVVAIGLMVVLAGVLWMRLGRQA